MQGAHETKANAPDAVARGERVIVFDGVCKLCHGWSRFVMRHDQAHRFRLTTAQSPAGQRILEYFDRPTTTFDSMVYIEDGRAFEKSDAFLRIVVRVGWPWKLLAVARICPRFIRDWCYDRIARHRYTIFGRYEACRLPTSDHQRRFLDDDPGSG